MCSSKGTKTRKIDAPFIRAVLNYNVDHLEKAVNLLARYLLTVRDIWRLVWMYLRKDSKTKFKFPSYSKISTVNFGKTRNV